VTKDEYIVKYRGRFLLFLAEAWACRKESPSSMGMVMDNHAMQLRHLLTEIWDDIGKTDELEPAPSLNGAARKRV